MFDPRSIQQSSDGLGRMGPEGRRHWRGVTVLRAGKVIAGKSANLCLIRNVSTRGMMADIHVPSEPGTRLTVMISEDLPVSGTVVWANGHTVGIEFDAEVAVEQLLAESARTADGGRWRLPRLELDCRATLRIGARTFGVRLNDISQGGVKLEADLLGSPGADAVLTMENFHPVQGVVRWRRAPFWGLSFNQLLGFRELSEWLAREPSQAHADLGTPMRSAVCA